MYLSRNTEATSINDMADYQRDQWRQGLNLFKPTRWQWMKALILTYWSACGAYLCL